jgi:hypothetical protein
VGVVVGGVGLVVVGGVGLVVGGGGECERAGGQVLARAAQVLARGDLAFDADPRRALGGVALQHDDFFDRNDGVVTVGHARAGHDLAGFATRRACGIAGGLFAFDGECAPGCDRGTLRAQGETVHRRVVERRQRHRRDDIFRKHATARIGQRQAFGWQELRRRAHARDRVLESEHAGHAADAGACGR